MKIARIGTALLVSGFLSLFTPSSLLTPTVLAESYVAAQFGYAFPQSLSNGKVTQDGLGGLDISDQPLKNSPMVGAKLGHYFSRARWLGVETEVTYSNPHVKQGALTFSGPGGQLTTQVLAGLHQRMIMWAPVTLLLRYPGYRLQPYVGVGPAVFFANLNGPSAPPGQSGTAIGLNAEAGVRYFITRHWSLSSEGKYNLARIGYISNDSNPQADPFGFRATYSVFTVSLAIGYHF
jgi:opacity protein-like surface antigen